MSEPVATLRLNPRESSRLRKGQLWIYSNQIDTRRTPLRGLPPGAIVDVVDEKARFVGRGTVNPATLISVRLLSREPAAVDGDFFASRLRRALDWRARGHTEPYYRLLHGEGDELPGLIVDRYGPVLVAQANTAGMDLLRELWLPPLMDLCGASSLLLRNDNPARALEGLPAEDEWIGPPVEAVEVPESGLRHRISLAQGQKTGWFYDQRPNRELFARLAGGARVLDVFSYVGGWGLGAAAAGAARVLCIDASRAALDQLEATAAAHDLRVETRCGDALEQLRALRDAGEVFDHIVVDPPALIKRRKDFEAGREHYARLNHVALQLLAPGGMLFAASCSHHMPAETLLQMVQREAARLGRRLQCVHQGGAGPDHPVHPAMPETAYLKVFALRDLSGA